MRHNYIRKQEDNKLEDRVKDRIITVFLIISLFLFIGSISQTSKKIRLVNKEVTSREEELKKLQAEGSELKAKYEKLTSTEYMESQLRNQLNLSKKNEVVLILPDAEMLKKLVPLDETRGQVDMTPNWKKWADIFGVLK